MKKTSLILAFVAISFFLFGCQGLKSLKTAFLPASPYEQYVESLTKAELLSASMTKEWLAAGQRVFSDSVIVDLPFSESGFLPASTPEARSYRFKVRDGQILTVNGAVKTVREARAFLDLFVKDEEEWERVASADSTFSIAYEFTRDQECVLRLQPELLANMYYALNISITPVLINPVYGASNKSIGSFYGAPRDNGKRSHEGVDIFAPKGTPVIAPTDGYITRVGVNTLGGKVVWMKDPKRGHSYYFAHLDSQMVKPGMKVYQGHVLGLVGNTGNARTTPPHLHFGIYQSGSKDPLYYIHKVQDAIVTLPIDTAFQQKAFRIRLQKAALMSGPSGKTPIKTRLSKNTYVTVIAQSNDWYRVELPDDVEGFILKKQLTALDDGMKTPLDTTRVLLSAIGEEAVPVATLPEKTTVEVLAHFREYDFVNVDGRTAGWLKN